MHLMSHAEAIARIGPKPEGDVAGMEGLAADLRRIAGGVGDTTDIRLPNWESDRARAAKARIAGAAATASTATCELNGAAGILAREAAELAVRQERWAARYADLTGRCPS
jgi:hypothetical protein